MLLVALDSQVDGRGLRTTKFLIHCGLLERRDNLSLCIIDLGILQLKLM